MFSQEFQAALQKYTAAVEEANTIKTNCWSLYLCVTPCNAENTFEVTFQYKNSYPTKEDAIESIKYIKISSLVFDPIWFVVEEIITASGKRFELDGRPIRIYKDGETLSYTYTVEEGIFNCDMIPDVWIPYYRAGGGLSGILHFLFKDKLPEKWNEKQAKEERISWDIIDKS